MTKRSLESIVLSLLMVASARGATITAASSSRADVGTAVTSAVDGDTVAIPAGTSDWTSTLTISKAITLQGAGTNSTVITTGVADGTPLITWNLVAGKASRMTAIKFKDGTQARTFGQLINVNGVNTDARTWRCDSCLFTNVNGVFLITSALGVADHNTIYFNVTAGVGYVKGSSWGGTQGINSFGDGAWAAADNFGTSNFFYFEDNWVSNYYNGGHLTTLDSQGGGRYVWRYNTLYKGSLESHGAEAERERSGRAFEVYNNSFLDPDSLGQNLVTYFRGGVQVIHDNTVSGYTASANFALLNNRSQDALNAPFGGSDGRNPWDANDAGNPFVTGTASSGGSLSMTDNTKSWTANQYVGYTVRRTSGKTVSSLTRSGSTCTATATAHGFSSGNLVSVFGADQQAYNGIYTITVTDADHFTFGLNFTPTSPATGTIKAHTGLYFGDITANTATTLTLRDSIYQGNYSMVWAAGETYEINKVTLSMDMAGTSGGSDLGGVDLPSLPGGWNNQTVSACYEWSNTREGGANVDFATSYPILVAGTHYKNDTVKPGYTAFTYPHPLVSGAAGGSTPSATPIANLGKSSIGKGQIGK
jgi:hypothetical protein